jgi:hypothetical protein
MTEPMPEDRVSKRLEALAKEFSHALPSCFKREIEGDPEKLDRKVNGAHVSFRLAGLHYSCEFDIDAYGQVHFHLTAYADGKKLKLNGERRASNTEIDKTHYISDRRLAEQDEGSVRVNCRIKRNVSDPSSRHALYADLTRYVVREVMDSAKAQN